MQLIDLVVESTLRVRYETIISMKPVNGISGLKTEISRLVAICDRCEERSRNLSQWVERLSIDDKSHEVEYEQQ